MFKSSGRLFAILILGVSIAGNALAFEIKYSMNSTSGRDLLGIMVNDESFPDANLDLAPGWHYGIRFDSWENSGFIDLLGGLRDIEVDILHNTLSRGSSIGNVGFQDFEAKTPYTWDVFGTYSSGSFHEEYVGNLDAVFLHPNGQYSLARGFISGTLPESNATWTVIPDGSNAFFGVVDIFTTLEDHQQFSFKVTVGDLSGVPAIPEPETYAMLLAGLSLILFFVFLRRTREDPGRVMI
jgi:hypothetical protein